MPRALPRWKIEIREREPRAEVAAWFGKTAVGEFMQRLAQPLAGGSLVAGVGMAALIGVFVSALVDLTVATPVWATASTAFVIGLAVGFGGGGPLPALASGLFGWLVGEVVEAGVSELVKEPASRTAGVVIGWCVAALIGWVAGRVATMLPWPWVIAAAGAAVAFGVRWAISCARDQPCAATVASGGLALLKWATIGAIWLFALVVLIWLRMLHASPTRRTAANNLLARLWPFALIYTFWWAPLLTVAAGKAFTAGYQPTSNDLSNFYLAMALSLVLVPGIHRGLLPIHRLGGELAVSTPQPRQVLVNNIGKRAAKRLTCRIEVEQPGRETFPLVHQMPPRQLAPGTSFTLTLGLAADNVPSDAELHIVLTWRDRLKIRQIRQPLRYPRKDPPSSHRAHIEVLVQRANDLERRACAAAAENIRQIGNKRHSQPRNLEMLEALTTFTKVSSEQLVALRNLHRLILEEAGSVPTTPSERQRALSDLEYGVAAMERGVAEMEKGLEGD